MDNIQPLLEDEDAKYLLLYINDVLIPSSEEFFSLLEKNEMMLHHAFSFNAIVTHAIDYMIFIAKKMGNATRTNFISKFDEKYYVKGAKAINNKFRLLDAINNSFKHVELDKTRYPKLIEEYGDLSFHSLKASNGKVYFDMPKYKFDYCRVVLKPVAAIFNCGLKTTEDVIDFINGEIFGSVGYEVYDYDYDDEPCNAIDMMIEYCNPQCLDCGEDSDSCECPTFLYADEKGTFVPNTDPNFDFEDVMSKISGTREWSK